MPLTGTILELLTTPNPALDLSDQPVGGVTKSPYYEPLESDHLEPWTDFTYENIKASCGHLFDLGPLGSDTTGLGDSQKVITEEAGVDLVGYDWNYKICREPLRRGAEVVQADLGVEPRVLRMALHRKNSRDPKTDAKAKAPDWCIFLWDSEKKEDDAVAVWGDGKCSSKWRSNMNTIPECKYKSNWIWPFRQVLSYCVNNATRYGYILTPEEVVVLRVYEDPSTPKSRWRVQYAAIPWDNHGEETLTVNLAIWALAMLSLNEGHRPIRSLEHTLPLDVWWENPGLEKDAAPVYEHHLSGRQVSAAERPAGLKPAARPTVIPEMEEREREARGAKRNRH